jgi:hypothetical protein
MDQFLGGTPGDRPEVIAKTYAHFIPGSGRRIAASFDTIYASKVGG